MAKWNASVGLQLTIDYDDIEADTKAEAIQIAKDRALEDIEWNNSDCDVNVTKLAPSEKVKIGTRTAHSATEQRLCAVFLKKGMTRKRIEKSAKKSYSKRINYATL